MFGVAALHRPRSSALVGARAAAALLVLIVAETAAAEPPVAKGTARPAVLAEADRLGRDHRDAYRRGAFARAESLAARQVELRSATLGPEHLDVALGLMSMGEYAGALGEDERAERAVRQALAIRVKILGPAHPDVAHARRELARTLIGPRRLIEADTLCREALVTQRVALGEKHPETLVTQGLLGRVLVERGRMLDGEKLMHEAEGGLQAVPAESEELRLQRAAIELDLARAWASLSRYVEAEALARRAQITRRSIFGDRHPDYALALDCLSHIANNRDDLAQAVDLAKESHEILRQALGEENRLVVQHMSTVAGVMTGVWQAPERMPSILAAEAWYRRADPVTRRVFGEHHPQLGELLAGLGWNLVLQNRGAEAESVFTLAQAIRQAAFGADDAIVNSILSYRARLAFQLGDFAKAETLLRKCLTSVEREKGSTNRTTISMVEGIGIMRGAQGDFAGAAENLSRAADVYERVRLRAGQGGARASFWTSPYERLALSHLELGHEAEAWAAVERLRGLAIADMLMATGEQSLTAGEQAREDSLVPILGDLENRLAAARSAATRDPLARSEAETLHEKLMAAEAAWNLLQADIERHQPVTESRTFSLERVQRALDGRTAIVGWVEGEFARGDARAWGYVIRDRGPVHWVRLEIGRGSAWYRTPGRQYREWLTGPSTSPLGSTPPDTTGQSRQFWDQRFAPLLPHLVGVTDLVLVPSGAMRAIPLETMRDPQDRYLLDHYATRYALSATIHAWLVERSPTRQSVHRGLLVGDPPFREEHLLAMTRGEESPADSTKPTEQELQSVLRGDRGGVGKLPRLRWSRREVEDVASALPRTDRLVGGDASERKIAELVHDHRMDAYDVLHFATHAITSDQRPEESALVLSQVGRTPYADSSAGTARAFDGLVSAAEVLREWTLKAQLVTLSACETAQGRTTSEGTFGIAQAFLRAGAHAALVSFWNVDDEATALLMKEFYTKWLGPGHGKGGPVLSKAEALRAAKRSLREHRDPDGRRRFEHPYYWAGFVLIGDGR